MAYERNPNDPFVPPSDPYGSPLPGDQFRREARLDNELQADPELAEGPASGGRIAMFAVAIALVLGAVFYGLNNSSINQASTSPASQTAQTSPPAAPPGMRDVTPRANTEPGVTTGAAPSTPVGPPATAPATQTANPPANNN